MESSQPQMTLFLRLIAVAVILNFSNGIDGSMIADVFKVCRRSDPDLNQCIVDSINGAKEKLAGGLKELGLLPFKPFTGEELEIYGHRTAALTFEILNYTWDNMVDFEVTHARMHRTKPFLELEVLWPETHGSGFYLIDGKLLILQMKGEDSFTFKVEGMNTTHRIEFEEVNRNGMVYWQVKDWKVYLMDVKSYYSYYNNIVPSNKQMSDFVNNFISENWKVILEEYHAQFAEAFGHLFAQITKKFFETVPLNKLFEP